MPNITIIGLMERRDSMFRKNKTHEQERLFSHFSDLDERLKKRLSKTWAPIFYENNFLSATRIADLFHHGKKRLG